MNNVWILEKKIQKAFVVNNGIHIPKNIVIKDF